MNKLLNSQRFFDSEYGLATLKIIVVMRIRSKLSTIYYFAESCVQDLHIF